MIKTLIAAIVSALTTHLITKHYADKRVIELHRSYDRKNDETHMNAYSRGWKDGHRQGYMTGNTDGHNNIWHLPEFD